MRSLFNPLSIRIIWIVCLGMFSQTPRINADNHAGEFGPTKVWSIHLEISANEFEAMQPTPPTFPGGPPPAKKKVEKKRETHRNLFGTEFPWVEATVTTEGKTLKKVGLRYSGDITYLMSAQSLKRPLRIGFDMFGGEKFHGLSGVQLQAMPLDPSKARQVIASELFRAAGVPTPRVAFAEVTLTVPGRHDKEFLGLYTVVEEVDSQFLANRFGSDKGLTHKPFGIRGIDSLGNDWARYQTTYRPQRATTKDEEQRLIDFAKLINLADDAEFKKRINEFIDVDAFLRFQAVNALTANLESYFAIGHNYILYLDPKSNKFHFIPGDLEFSLAGFLLMGNANQVMDLSLLKPYPGENKLPDRLLAIAEIKERYLKIVGELTQKEFTKERLLKDIDAIESTTNSIREKEAKALALRKEPPGFGGGGPQAPSLKMFAEKRTESVTSQLAGKSKGYVPQALQFGPPPAVGGIPPAKQSSAIDEKAFATEVQVPPEFEATLFAVPPKVNYPVAIACEPTGEVYVAVDEQGSLGRTPGGGKILRCADRDGDGKVDVVTVFAKVDHPRGVTYRNGKLWVMHPPTLSVFEDTNGDGISDKQEVLVTGLTTSQITDRGGDHTTNCVRMGIDGWLYISVGDYGIQQAKGKDGRTITLRGGGVVRVRPDGTELEIYCTGLRNPFDLAIDGFMNIFARDNTNDGAGWDTRVSLLTQSASYGYTQLFANFTDEIMPTLGVFGSGGATGGLFVQDSRWPTKYGNTLLTGDWGRSEVYRHELKPNGPTFDLKQELFIKMPRATGMDIDGSGRLYIASWRNGSAVGFEGPNVGFVSRVTPKNFKPIPFPNLKTADLGELIKLLASPQSVTRLHAQGELLARGRSAEVHRSLVKLALNDSALLEGRVAAIYTLKQLEGAESHSELIKLLQVSTVKEFALRALTDRLGECAGLHSKAFVAALADESPRVQAQALISLGRLGDKSAAKQVLPLTARKAGSKMPTTRPLQNQPDADRVVPHLAVRTLVALNAIEDCLEAVDGPHAPGAFWAMRYMHDAKTVDGLVKKLSMIRSPESRRDILATLIRLYYREADYTGTWWGIRPDNTGPYFDRAEWAMTRRIGAVVTAAIQDADKELATFLKSELARHRVSLAGVTTNTDAATVEKPLVLPKADTANPNQIANLPAEVITRRTLGTTGDAKRGEQFFKSQSCVACHTTADGQTPKGPHLFEIGKRYKTDELIESILKPSAKLAQGFEAYRFEMTDGRVVTGFVVSERSDTTIIRESDGVRRELNKNQIESKTILKISAMPEGLAANLTPEQLADLIAYLESLK